MVYELNINKAVVIFKNCFQSYFKSHIRKISFIIQCNHISSPNLILNDICLPSKKHHPQKNKNFTNIENT